MQRKDYSIYELYNVGREEYAENQTVQREIDCDQTVVESMALT